LARILRNNRTLAARNGWRYGLLLLAAAVGFAFTLIGSAEGGVVVTPDSTSYLAATRSLQAGQGFLRFDDDYYTQWPPLYPLLLVLVDRASQSANLSLVEGIRILNAFTMAAVHICAGVLLMRFLHSPFFIVAGVVASLFHHAFLITSVHAWSEPLFILLVMLFLLQMDALLSRPTLRALILLSVIVGLATLQRYLGVTLIAAGSACLLLLPHPQRFLSRVRNVIVFAIITLLPLGLWFQRNLAVEGVLIRDVSFSTPITDDPNRGIFSVPVVVAQAFLPQEIAAYLPPILGLAVLLALVIVACVGVRSRGPLRLRTMPVSPIGVLLLVYALSLVIFTSQTQYGAIDNRFLAPVFVPLLCVLFSVVERFMRWWGGVVPASTRRVALALPALLAVAFVLVYPVQQTMAELKTLSGWCCYDAGYDENSVLNWLREHPVDGLVQTNAPLPLYYTPAYVRQIPRNLENARSQRLLPQFIIWFNEDVTPCGPARFCYREDYSLTELRGALPVETLLETPEGAVLRVLPDS